ncbi:MAG: flippase-like domain-containing protein, partial [Desulfobacteraceae bacterium]|nr:flippase-like domain-containing protein [Desulfobacteraceae bacterium]
MKLLQAARIGSPVLIASLFVLIFFYADLDKIGRAFAGIRWTWALWVPVLNVVNTFVEGLRLSVILLPLTGSLHVRSAFNSTLVGIIGNVMLPLRFGDGARAYYIARNEKIGLSRSFSALTLDRAADFLLFFAMMALTAILHPFPSYVTKMGLIAAAIFAAFAAAILLLIRVEGKIGNERAGRIRRRVAEETGKFV